MINFIPMPEINIESWLQLVTKQLPEPAVESEERADPEKELYLYQCQVKEAIQLDDEEHRVLEEGQYIGLAPKGDIDPLFNPRKLSFTEIVYLTDLIVGTADIENISNSFGQDQINELAVAGKLHKEAEQFFQLFDNPVAQLTRMSERTAKSYFTGLSGLFLSIFSALANFFRKYDLYIHTGIYWPGNSCQYAGRVIDQIQKVRQVCLKGLLERAVQTNYKLLCESMGIDSTESRDPEEVKKFYRNCIIEAHPDHNRAENNAHERAGHIIRLYQDYRELQRQQQQALFKINVIASDGLSQVRSRGSSQAPFKNSKPLLAITEH